MASHDKAAPKHLQAHGLKDVEKLAPHASDAHKRLAPHASDAHKRLAPHASDAHKRLAPHPGEEHKKLLPHPGEAHKRLAPHPGEEHKKLLPHPGEEHKKLMPHPNVAPHHPGEEHKKIAPHPGVPKQQQFTTNCGGGELVKQHCVPGDVFCYKDNYHCCASGISDFCQGKVAPFASPSQGDLQVACVIQSSACNLGDKNACKLAEAVCGLLEPK